MDLPQPNYADPAQLAARLGINLLLLWPGPAAPSSPAAAAPPAPTGGTFQQWLTANQTLVYVAAGALLFLAIVPGARRR